MSNRIVALSLFTLSLTAASPASVAGSLDGVSLPDQATVGGKTLTLNGMGLRTATFLKVKVYVMGLYLESKSTDAKMIIDSDQTKRIDMRFVHDVTAKELRDGWSEGFEDNYSNVAAIQKEIDTFNAGMRDMKDGGRIVLDFVGDKVDVTVDGSNTAALQGKAFQQALLSIWLGPKPPSAELKQGLLGG